MNCTKFLLALALAAPALSGSREDLVRKLICDQVENDPYEKVPYRVAFASVSVGDGQDNIAVVAKFTTRGYFNDSTLAKDREAHYTLMKQGPEWILMQGTGGTDSPIRYEPKSAPPPKGQFTASAQAPPAPSRVAAAGGAATVPLGHYQCVMSAGGQLITVGEFTLQSGGKYLDSDGKAGTYITNANERTLVFRGGAMEGQTAAITEHGLQLKSRRNSVDCDRTK